MVIHIHSFYLHLSLFSNSSYSNSLDWCEKKWRRGWIFFYISFVWIVACTSLRRLACVAIFKLVFSSSKVPIGNGHKVLILHTVAVLVCSQVPIGHKISVPLWPIMRLLTDFLLKSAVKRWKTRPKTAYFRFEGERS